MVNVKFLRSCTAALAVLCAMGTSSCGTDASSGTVVGEDGGPRLVVLPAETEEGMWAKVSGTLAVNDRGCFVLDDRVLVVGAGSRVLDDGKGIEIADVGVVRVGERTSGGGGEWDGLDDVQYYADAMDLGEGPMDCQEDKASPRLTVLDPSSN